MSSAPRFYFRIREKSHNVRLGIFASQASKRQRGLAEVLYQHDVGIFQLNFSIEDRFAVG
jgi:hypothetical protein